MCIEKMIDEMSDVWYNTVELIFRMRCFYEEQKTSF